MTKLTYDEFSVQIRRAMENLHDFAYLERLPLVQAMSSPDRTTEQSVRRLRSELLDIIERLKPPSGVPVRSKGYRPYELLYGRYVQCMTTEELVEELAISLRQLRREQKRALAAVVALARDRLGDVLEEDAAPASLPLDLADSANGADDEDGDEGDNDAEDGADGAGAGKAEDASDAEGVRRTAADQEVEQLIQRATTETIVLADLLQTVRPMLDALAAKQNTGVRCTLPEHLPTFQADRIVVRQALIELLSIALDHSWGGVLEIGAAAADGRVVLLISAGGPQDARARTGIGQAVSAKLLDSAGAQLGVEETPEGWRAQIRFPAEEHANILIIDDNAGLIQLFRRYLAGQPRYHVFDAGSGREAVERANFQPLHLVILDVMMPGQDGWELLQILRSEAATAAVPIMVCSVLNEPQIALALGASDYLTKPVTQDALLLKVERWCSARLAQAAAQPARHAKSAGSPSP